MLTGVLMLVETHAAYVFGVNMPVAYPNGPSKIFSLLGLMPTIEIATLSTGQKTTKSNEVKAFSWTVLIT